MTDEAIYRLQIQSSASQVFFSYLPDDVELQLTNPLTPKPVEPPIAPIAADSCDSKKLSESEAVKQLPLEPSDTKSMSSSEHDAKRPLEAMEEPDPEAQKAAGGAEPDQKRTKTEEKKPDPDSEAMKE